MEDVLKHNKCDSMMKSSSRMVAENSVRGRSLSGFKVGLKSRISVILYSYQCRGVFDMGVHFN